MLVLNRRPGESIVIGDNIKITAIETSRAGVRLGIEAPRDIPVHREEIADRIANGELMKNDREPITWHEYMAAFIGPAAVQELRRRYEVGDPPGGALS